MLTAASELTPGVSTLQETDGFKPLGGSCSLRVLSESKDRPRQAALPGLGGALLEEADGGMAPVGEAWGGETAPVPIALPASPLLWGLGARPTRRQ